MGAETLPVVVLALAWLIVQILRWTWDRTRNQLTVGKENLLETAALLDKVRELDYQNKILRQRLRATRRWARFYKSQIPPK